MDLSPIKVGGPAVDDDLQLPEGYDDPAFSFKNKHNKKTANPNYVKNILGKVPTTGSRTKWDSVFEKPLEYFMFPSLQLLPQEVQDDEIVKTPIKQPAYGSGSRSTMNYGGSNSPKSIKPSGLRISPSTSPGGGRKNRRSPSPQRKGQRHKQNSASSVPDDFRDTDSYNENGSSVNEKNQIEDSEPQYNLPDIYWEVDIYPPDPKRADDAAEIKAKEFNKELERGEKYQRQRLINKYEEDIAAAQRKEEEKKRAKNMISSRLREQYAAAHEKEEYEKARIGKGRRRGRGQSMSKGMFTEETRRNSTRADSALRKKSVAVTGVGRKSSILLDSGRGNKSVIENINTPQYIYRSLRNTGKKKQGAGGILNDLLASIKTQINSEEIGGHVDDESTYHRQMNKLKNFFGDKGYTENAYDMEGLLYYRFQYDAQREEEKANEIREEEERLAYTQPGRAGYTSTGTSVVLNGKKGVHSGSKGDDDDDDDDDESPAMKKFHSDMLRKHKGGAVLKADVSSVNLSRLRRAVQHGITGISKTNMVDSSEVMKFASKKTEEAVKKATSKEKPKKIEKPLQEIRDREKELFLKSMGLDSDVEEKAIETLEAATATVKRKGENKPSQDTHQVQLNSPQGKPYGLEAGSVDGLGGISTYSPEARVNSKLNKQGVTGNSRTAQDALIMAQLSSGVLPQAFISRSDNLDHITIDISSYSIGDEQGLCLATAIKGLNYLRSLLLSDNRLTSRSLPAIIQNILPDHLMQLDLSSNVLHNEGIKAVSELLMSSQSVLNNLQLSKCGLTCADLPGLVKGMKMSSVTNLNLSNNLIGVQGSVVLSEIILFERCSLKRLDLAWNKIGTEGAISLAISLAKNTSLKHLSLSANGIADRGGQKLAQSLYHNASLEELFLNQNNINGGSCFVFSKTVALHPKLTKLDLSFNPVGEAGARSIYRQIMRGLRCFVVMRSCSYFHQDGMFNFSTPGLNSPYELELSEPYQQSLMQELILMVKEDPHGNRFGTIKYTQGSSSATPGITEEINLVEKHGEMTHKGKIYKIPHSGKLVVPFFSAIATPTLKDKVSNKSLEVLKLIITHAREQDRLDYLKLITADMYMTCNQAQSVIDTFIKHQIIGSGGLRKIDILACTWTRLLDTENMYDFMCHNIIPSERRLLINEVSIDEYKFNWTNPTGHWRLNLEQHKQLHVMMKVISVNQSESEYSRSKSGREDTSQNGNWFNFRNAKRITRKGAEDIIIDQDFCDNLPRSGIIEFDYVSTTRPLERLLASNGTQTKISDATFYELMDKLRLSNRKRVTAENSLFPLIELQLAVTKYWFTVHQVMAVMDMFDQHNFHTQSNVVVAMFGRIKDLHNMDMLLRNVELKTQREILNRLGCLNVLNPLKLALNYQIPLVHLDYRVLLTTLLEISPQEGTEQIREDAKTDVSVLTFYGALHRIVAVSRPEILRFIYLDFGVQTNVVAWGLRRDAIKKFLVGTQPLDKSMYKIIGMYREMEKHNTLSRGPLELQYANHFKIMKNSRKQANNEKTASITVSALRNKVSDAKAATVTDEDNTQNGIPSDSLHSVSSVHPSGRGDEVSHDEDGVFPTIGV
eukprot:GSChrysophyteH1.ASY1.ANO1.3066.1 assembled CDS